MKLEKQRLRGFTGIKRGLGLDEIEIDFSGITGLTALEGDNGSGKTTVLENLHPFNQLASREGALYQHVCSRKAEKELSFFYADHRYKTLLKIDCESERSEGFIWKDGHPEVKGKISEYARYMKGFLGSPELFFASVFCAQKSKMNRNKQIENMTSGGLKDLVVEFIKIERYQKWEDTAKQAGNVLNGKAGLLDARTILISERIAGKATKATDKEWYAEKLRSKEIDRTERSLYLTNCRWSADQLKETVSKNALHLARKTDIETSIHRLRYDLSTEKSAAEAEIESLKRKWRELAEEIKKHDAILMDKEKIEGAAEKEKALQGKIELLTAEIEKLGSGIADGQEAVHGLELNKAILNNLLKDNDLNNDPENQRLGKIIEDAVRAHNDKTRELNALGEDVQLINLAAEIKALEKAYRVGDGIDESCKSITCAAIKSVNEAREKYPQIKESYEARYKEIAEMAAKLNDEIKDIKQNTAATIEERAARIETLKAENARLAAQISTKEQEIKAAKAVLQTGNQALEEKRKALVALRFDLLKVKELAAKASIVQVAEQRKADIEKQQAEIAEQGKAKREAINKRVADFDLEIDAKKVEVEECERSIDHDAECRLKALAAEIEKIETVDIPAIEKDIQESREKLATLKAELEKIQEAEKELEQVRKEKDRLAGDVSHWRYLQTACGKNGLQALEIDGTAPLITGYANNLLSQAFGPLFSVKLVTQDENGKECLDIMVLTEDGSEILLDNLSGGQKVWNLMALRLAMTLLSKEKSGLAFMTAFADELDGALDPENALNFVGMYRSFMQIGGFSDFLFISHKPSCRGMADNVLKFEAGKAPWWA